MRPWGKLGAVALFAMMTGCEGPSGASDAQRWAGTRDTLASGRVVVENEDVPLWREGQRWILEERFRLGALSEEGPDLFGRVSAVELGDDGSVYVLEAQASEVRVFGPEGVHQRTFGRGGQGPGELNRPAGMALDAAGVLWVVNWGNARYTGFDPGTGELVRETRRRASFVVFPWPGRFDEEGRLLDVGLDGDGQPAILRLDTAFVPADTMRQPLPREEDHVSFRRGDRMVMAAMEPFAPRPFWAARGREGIVLGEGREYRIHRVSFAGDTTMTVTLRRAPVRVTAAERDSALAAFDVLAQSVEGAVADRRARVPDTKPAHGPIFVDDRDRTWVRAMRGEAEEPAWDVFDRDGRYLGPVEIPIRLGYPSPAVRGDRLAVVAEVEGVPTVVVYRIVGMAG